MESLLKSGRILFAIAIAIAFFGVQVLLFATGAHLPLPGPPWTQYHAPLAALAGIGLLAAALCIALPWRGRLAAYLLAAGIILRALILYLPPLLAHLRDPGPWTSLSELLALGGAALILAATLPPPPNLNAAPPATIGRVFFAASLIVFGVQHWMYGPFVATLIPSWIPFRLFWSYAVGLAFFVAAVSIFVRRLVQPVATLLAAMFLLWVVILHVPRVAAAPHSGDEWTSLGIALAFGASSLLIAGARPLPKA
jgi:hypothetical protein